LRPSFVTEAGFSLVEVLIAISLLTAVAMSVGQLFAVATMSNLNAKGATSSAILAVQKMEQLRGLTWGFNPDSELGLPLSDTTTNLSVDPPANGGSGLNPSPSGSLDNNVAGYVDFLDAAGKSLGTGGAPPNGTQYVRRWSIEPLPTNPNNTLILQVRVTTLRRESRRTISTPGTRLPDDTWLVSVKTRKAP
jgi:prepilin-type N-terminal cleavage/methylation domain-containing protein